MLHEFINDCRVIDKTIPSALINWFIYSLIPLIFTHSSLITARNLLLKDWNSSNNLLYLFLNNYNYFYLLVLDLVDVDIKDYELFKLKFILVAVGDDDDVLLLLFVFGTLIGENFMLFLPKICLLLYLLLLLLLLLAIIVSLFFLWWYLLFNDMLNLYRCSLLLLRNPRLILILLMSLIVF